MLVITHIIRTSYASNSKYIFTHIIWTIQIIWSIHIRLEKLA